MSIHYKFKSALDFDTITFDGLHISVSDLKKSIIHQKRLGKTIDFDLKITNAQTKEEYDDDSFLIPKNTSLIIARIPLAYLPKKAAQQLPQQPQNPKGDARVNNVILDISKMNGSEEEKIQAMMLQSAADYDPKGYHRIRGQSQTGEVPTSYRCNKCKMGGHWIKNCPYPGKDHIEIKRTTGIPKSFREKDDSLQEVDEIKPIVTEQNEKIPEDLICSICKDIFTDAVMIPCCGSSFCDDCVRTALLESEDNECPDCGEKGSSPGSLIPNRFLRNSVNSFKNETGYSVKERKENKPVTKKPPPEIEEEPDTIKDTEEQVKLPTPDNPESDYEDNIVVTVSTPSKSKSDTIKSSLNEEKNVQTQKPASKEHTPERQMVNTATISRSSHMKSPRSSKYDTESHDARDKKEGKYDDDRREAKPEVHNTIPQKHISSQIPTTTASIQNCPPREIQSVELSKHRHETFSRQDHVYQQIPLHVFPNQGPIINGPHLGYNCMTPAPCSGYPNFMHQPYNPRSGYMPMDNQGSRPIQSSMNLASVYQGVAAKVGSGVIDDPLEAFNRIMREKERYKERQGTPSSRRSCSPEKSYRSWNSPTSVRRNRSRLSPHSSSRDRREQPRNRKSDRDRGHESQRNRKAFLYSDRNSRSKSRSISISRKRMDSPNHYRYSRSKSPLASSRHRHQKNLRTDSGKVGSRNESPGPSFRLHQMSSSEARRNSHDEKEQKHKQFNIRTQNNEPPPPGYENVPTNIGHKYEQMEKRIPDSQKYSTVGHEKIVSNNYNERKGDRIKRNGRSSSNSRKRSLERRSKSKDRGEKHEFSSQKHVNINYSENECTKNQQYNDHKRIKVEEKGKHDSKHSNDIIGNKKDNIEKDGKNTQKSDNHKRNENNDRHDKEEKLEKKSKDRLKRKKYKEDKERKRQKKEKREDRINDDTIPRNTENTDSSNKYEMNEHEQKYTDLKDSEMEDTTSFENKHSDLLLAESNSSKMLVEDHDENVFIPALSKWEREDESMQSVNSAEENKTKTIDNADTDFFRTSHNSQESSMVDEDSMKHFSNRQNFHTDEKSTPKISIRSNSRENMERVKVTIPISSMQQRSVEIKDDKEKREHSPVNKSIKDRLGIKVTEKKTSSRNDGDSRNNPYKSYSRGPKSQSNEFNLDRKERQICRQEENGDKLREHNNHDNQTKSVYNNMENFEEYRNIEHSTTTNRDHHGKGKSEDTSKKSNKFKDEKSRKRHHSSSSDANKSRSSHNGDNNSRATKEHREDCNSNEIKRRKEYDRSRTRMRSRSHSLSADKSFSSNASDSDMESDNVKRKKKRKQHKEKKGKKRSSSIQSESSKKRSNKKKKKSKKKKSKDNMN